MTDVVVVVGRSGDLRSWKLQRSSIECLTLFLKKLLATKSTMRRFDRCFGRGFLSKRWFCLVKIFLALLIIYLLVERRSNAAETEGPDLEWKSIFCSVAGMDVLGVSDQADDTV